MQAALVSKDRKTLPKKKNILNSFSTTCCCSRPHQSRSKEWEGNRKGFSRVVNSIGFGNGHANRYAGRVFF